VKLPGDRGDGSLNWVENAEDLESAKGRVEELAEFWPGKYVILNEGVNHRRRRNDDELARELFYVLRPSAGFREACCVDPRN
jgi:hypothetical protein